MRLERPAGRARGQRLLRACLLQLRAQSGPYRGAVLHLVQPKGADCGSAADVRGGRGERGLRLQAARRRGRRQVGLVDLDRWQGEEGEWQQGWEPARIVVLTNPF